MADLLSMPLDSRQSLTYLREPIVSKALERKLREWTIVNTLEALDSKFILTKANKALDSTSFRTNQLTKDLNWLTCEQTNFLSLS